MPKITQIMLETAKD